MAKKHTHEVTGDETLVTVAIPAGLVLKYEGWSLDAATASPVTLAYCLQNGFHQSMVDAAAFSKEDKAGKSEAEVTDMANVKRDKRFAAICDGKVNSRVGGPRAKGLDKYIIEAANKAIAAFAAKSGKFKMPDGKGAAEKLAVLRTNWLADAKRAADVRTAAEAAMAADEALTAGVEDFDFSTAAE